MEPNQDEVISLDRDKARQLFERMKDLPFLTVVFTSEGAKVYLKGDINEEDMSYARQVIEEIERNV